jgi:Mrp family chromosome partitioning ATPase
VSETFDLQNQLGLTDYLERDDVQIEDIIHPVGIKRLRCLTMGKVHTSSSEHFTHPKFRSCLLKLKERYSDRHIILDGPPLLSSSDAGVLLDVCDQVIIVLPFGKVDQTMLTTLSKLVDKEKLAGMVYNEYVE